MNMTKNNISNSPKQMLGKARKLEPLNAALNAYSSNVNNNQNNINSNNSNYETGSNQSKTNFFKNNNKMEVSIKATVCFSNDENQNRTKKIEINPNINVNNPNIMNINMNNNLSSVKNKVLEQIPEQREKQIVETEGESQNFSDLAYNII